MISFDHFEEVGDIPSHQNHGGYLVVSLDFPGCISFRKKRLGMEIDFLSPKRVGGARTRLLFQKKNTFVRMLFLKGYLNYFLRKILFPRRKLGKGREWVWKCSMVVRITESKGEVLINTFATWGHYQIIQLFPSPATSAALHSNIRW